MSPFEIAHSLIQESGDTDQMQQKTAALTQAAMKLGQAMYQQQQAEAQGAAGAPLVTTV